MTEQEWLACGEPRWMLEHLGRRALSRKLRLFACACFRRVWSRVNDPTCRAAVEVAERFADRRASNPEREKINKTVLALCRARGSSQREADLAYHVSRGTRYTFVDATIAAERTVFLAADVRNRGDKPEQEDAERLAKSQLLHDIYGNPFRPVTVDPGWQTSNVIALAKTVYDDRSFDRMPILADALEDAGCTSAELLEHCRSESGHVRGCWVVDIILGKA